MKPSSDFLHTELTKEEATKLVKLEEIAAGLESRKNLQNRQLQSWLSADQYEQIAAEWDTQKQFRGELKDKPSELKRYEDKLKEPIMMRLSKDALSLYAALPIAISDAFTV